MQFLQVATPIVVFAIVGAVVLAWLARTSSPSDTLSSDVAIARRHAAVVSALAMALASAAAAATVLSTITFAGLASVPGLSSILAPFAFGITHTVVVGLGELTWPRPSGATRRARLVRRTPFTVARGWLGRLLAASSALGFVVVIVGALLAAPDGMTIGFGQNEAPALRLGQVTVGVFPGRVIGVPVAVVMIGLLVLTTGVLWTVANRPAVSGDVANDQALRDASAFRALRGSTATMLVVDGGLLFYGGFSAVTAFPAGWLHWTAYITGAVGIVLGLAGLALLCVPAPRVRAAVISEAAGSSRAGVSSSAP